jgi:hypothetical protein
MNHAFKIARRRAERVAKTRTPHKKRTHILFCLDALSIGLSINSEIKKNEPTPTKRDLRQHDTKRI